LIIYLFIYTTWIIFPSVFRHMLIYKYAGIHPRDEELIE